MKEEAQSLARYCEVAKDTDFVRNTALYQPYGNYYFLYDGEHTFHLIKADNLHEKRIIMTMPVHSVSRSEVNIID